MSACALRAEYFLAEVKRSMASHDAGECPARKPPPHFMRSL